MRAFFFIMLFVECLQSGGLLAEPPASSHPCIVELRKISENRSTFKDFHELFIPEHSIKHWFVLDFFPLTTMPTATQIEQLSQIKDLRKFPLPGQHQFNTWFAAKADSSDLQLISDAASKLGFGYKLALISELPLSETEQLDRFPKIGSPTLVEFLETTDAINAEIDKPIPPRIGNKNLERQTRLFALLGVGANIRFLPLAVNYGVGRNLPDPGWTLRQLNWIQSIHPQLLQPEAVASFSIDIQDPDLVRRLHEKLLHDLKTRANEVVIGLRVIPAQEIHDYVPSLERHRAMRRTPGEANTLLTPLKLALLTFLFGDSQAILDSFGSLPWANNPVTRLWGGILGYDYWNSYKATIKTLSFGLIYIRWLLGSNSVSRGLNACKSFVDLTWMATLGICLFASPAATTNPHIAYIASIFLLGGTMRALGGISDHQTAPGNIAQALSLIAGGAWWQHEYSAAHPGVSAYFPMFLSLYGADKILTSLFIKPKFLPLSLEEGSLAKFISKPTQLEPLHLVRRIRLDTPSRRGLSKDLRRTHGPTAKALKKRPHDLIVHEFVLPKCTPTDSTIPSGSESKNPADWNFIQIFTVEPEVPDESFLVSSKKTW